MKGQRMAVYASVLTTAVVITVVGLAARGGDALTSGEQRRADRERQVERQIDVVPGDRRLIQLDGRGSQLGVMVSDTDDATGVRVDTVEDGSAAAKGGVKAGDVVVDFDGERVRSARQLTRLVQETPAGRAVKMTVRRGADRQTLDVTPDARESFAWNGRLGPELEREIQRGMERGLRDLPERIEPFFDFHWREPAERRFDGGMPAMGGRGRLGVQVEGLSEQLATYFGVTEGGVLVAGVTADSPAAKAGVKAGDVITRVNGEAVKDPGDLMEALGEVKGDGVVALDIVRDRKATSLKATIEPRRPSRPARGGRPG
ncbi:MAG: PDZ domain-containing protein [Acidobacteria bacterium]|nr:PDZ domain-containing protein [Acidobacteriota bacterium]